MRGIPSDELRAKIMQAYDHMPYPSIPNVSLGFPIHLGLNRHRIQTKNALRSHDEHDTSVLTTTPPSRRNTQKYVPSSILALDTYKNRDAPKKTLIKESSGELRGRKEGEDNRNHGLRRLKKPFHPQLLVAGSDDSTDLNWT